MAVKIAVANQKGGVGKTTTAICVAEELIRRGKRVLFIDTDSQCNSTSFFGAKTEDTSTMLDILCGDMDAKECIQHTENGNIIPSDKELRDAENMVKNDERRFSHLKRSCRSIENDYDYIIIDTPPVIGVTLKNVLGYANKIIIPVEESGWSLQGIMDFSDAIDLARDNNESLEVSGILIVKSKKNTNKSKRIGELADKLAEKLSCGVFPVKIRESVKCAEALTEYYVPLHEYDKSCTTQLDYEQFVDILLEREGN